jgi:hypothetical protein
MLLSEICGLVSERERERQTEREREREREEIWEVVVRDTTVWRGM